MKRNDILIAAVGISILAVLAVGYFKNMSHESVPGENKYRLANRYLEDGKNEEALNVFNESLSLNPQYKEAFLGKAITLMQLERYDESGALFDQTIALDGSFAEAYANRGILNDRTGNFEKAAEDYRTAISLKPKLAKGPGRLWKFLHNVSGKVPTIADRADYIEEQLKKPEEERLLRVPEIDARQRMYKK